MFTDLQVVNNISLQTFVNSKKENEELLATIQSKQLINYGLLYDRNYH